MAVDDGQPERPVDEAGNPVAPHHDGGLDATMPIDLSTPDVSDLGQVTRALREWQHDSAPVRLHPGDIGWFWRFGPEATAAALRIWRRDSQVVAVGLLDGPRLLRLATAPDAHADPALARRLVDDVTRPELGVLPEGGVDVEVPSGSVVDGLLADDGWSTGETMTPLRRDLTRPVERPAVRIEVVGSGCADERAAVQRSAFEGSTFTTARWHAMAAGPLYADARCLVAYDGDTPAAALTVWSAGPGRPGLVEPLGTHPAHRGRGLGRAVTLAGAAALRDLGSSSAVVCTMSSLRPAVATYRSAGFQALPEVRDRHRAGA